MGTTGTIAVATLRHSWKAGTEVRDASRDISSARGIDWPSDHLGWRGGGGDFEISQSTTAGGGVMPSAGGDFELSGTIGQPEAGILDNGTFNLTGGFWFPLAPGDCNLEGGVDLLDGDVLSDDLSGPEVSITETTCKCFDLDRDDDIDLGDAAAFQHSLTSA